MIHAGVYYKPGSEKARLCSAGRQSMVDFCKEHGVAHEICGKLVVATDASELDRLNELAERCKANNVPVERVGPGRIRELEPHAAGIAALHVPVTGIADYPGVCAVLGRLLVLADVEIRLSTAVTGMVTRGERLIVETAGGDVEARAVVNCGGLHSDRIARALTGTAGMEDVQIIPFRGEYFELAPSRTHLVRNLIYPVPDPRFPFLGVHLTRGVNGHVHAGPNAVLGLAREGYSWHHRNLGDVAEYLRFPGFRHLAKKYWRYGMEEMYRSVNRAVFTKALGLDQDLTARGMGVRSQRYSMLVEDGVVKAVHLEQGPKFEVSDAGTMLKQLGA